MAKGIAWKILEAMYVVQMGSDRNFVRDINEAVETMGLPFGEVEWLLSNIRSNCDPFVKLLRHGMPIQEVAKRKRQRDGW